MAELVDFVIIGPFIHSTQSSSMELIEQGAIGILGSKIVFVDKEAKIKEDYVQKQADCRVFVLKDG